MIHYVLILAAGKGLRLKNAKIPKQFLELDNLPIVMHSALEFKKADPNSQLYIALPQGFISTWQRLCKKYNFNIPHKTYVGGLSRSETVLIGLNEIHNHIQSREITKLESIDLNKSSHQHLISIHDAARPFINSKFILELIKSAQKYHNAVPVINLKSSLRKFKTEKKLISSSRDRTSYMLTQTPQVFNFSDIYNAYLKITQLGKENHDNNFFDDSSVFDYLTNNQPVNIVDGREYNIKITNDLDYFLAPSIYKFLQELT